MSDDKDWQKEYWDLIKICLVELFGFTKEKAEIKADQEKKELDALDRDDDPLYYHEEPLYIAANLAGKYWPEDKDFIESISEKYGKIRDDFYKIS